MQIIIYRITLRPVVGLFACVIHLTTVHGNGIQSARCAYPMDIVFVLDGSESVTHKNFNKVKKFTTDIVDQFSLGNKHVRIGVIEFSTFIGKVIELGQVSNPALLNFLIGNISMSNDGTGTHKALKRMREMFRERGRPEVPLIGVVITDGLSVSPYLTKEEARRVHLEGVKVFAVGIEGDKTFQAELEYIASSKDQALRVSDFDALPLNLSSSLCSIAVPSSTPRTTILTSSIIPDRIGESSGKNDGYVDESRYFQVHSTDCTKYIEVVPGVSGVAATYVKSCPFGLFWDEKSLTCINSTHGECYNDPCRRFSAGYTYTMDGLCSGFWTCLNKTSLPVCCSLGHRFQPSQGCVPDTACGQPCPPKQNTLTNRDCRKWVDPEDSKAYLEEVHNRNISRPCAPGSFFDQSACGCTQHATQNPMLVTSVSPNTINNYCRDELYLKFNKGQDGNRDGFKDFSGRNIHVAQRNVVISDRGEGMMELDGNSSCLNIWRFSNIEYRNLVISIKFLALQSDNPQTQTKYQALLSNCYYKSCTASVAIVLDRINHVIGAQTQTAGTGRYIWWHPTKYLDGVLNAVTLSFDRKGTVINFSLNKENRKQYIQEMVLLRQTGLVIGAGGLYDNFKGFVDEIRVQHCDGDPPDDV